SGGWRRKPGGRPRRRNRQRHGRTVPRAGDRGRRDELLARALGELDEEHLPASASEAELGMLSPEFLLWSASSDSVPIRRVATSITRCPRNYCAGPPALRRVTP